MSYVKPFAHLSTFEKVEPVDIAKLYIGVNTLIAELDLGQIQELSVQ